MKSVLLIGPSTSKNINDTRWVTAPLGVHYISSWLNANGHYCEVWDQNIDTDTFENRVGKRHWDIIGFSVLEATKEYDLARIHLSEKLSPFSLLVAGGFGASLDYQMLFDHSPLDAVVQAEGELPLLQLCNMLDTYTYSRAPLHMILGMIFRHRAQSLSTYQYQMIRKELDFKAMKADQYWAKTAKLYDSPDFDEVNSFRLNTSNYCPMNCAFCTLTNLRKYACGEPGKVRYLNEDQIITLIQGVIKSYPDCRRIFFCDDDFLISQQRGIKFCEKVIQAKKEGQIPSYLSFICLTNINRINEKNIGLLAEAGFKVISIGVESLSQRVLDSLDKKQRSEQVKEVTELIISHGITPYYSLILFTPYANMDDLIGDIIGFKRLGDMGVGLSIEPYLIPLKGTRLAEEQAPQRVRKVFIDGTQDFIYKGFAWLPVDPEVKKVFDVFEEIYPKLRKLRMEEAKGTHTEKKFQAYILLEAAELAIFMVTGNRITNMAYHEIQKIVSMLHKMEDCKMDVVGEIQS